MGFDNSSPFDSGGGFGGGNIFDKATGGSGNAFDKAFSSTGLGSTGGLFGGGSKTANIFDQAQGAVGGASNATDRAQVQTNFGGIGANSVAMESMFGNTAQTAANNRFNVRAQNFGNMSVVDTMRGLEGRRIDLGGDISVAEMYNDKRLDKRVMGGTYNVTISDVYTDKTLYRAFHGLTTDGTIKEGESTQTDMDTEHGSFDGVTRATEVVTGVDSSSISATVDKTEQLTPMERNKQLMIEKRDAVAKQAAMEAEQEEMRSELGLAPLKPKGSAISKVEGTKELTANQEDQNQNVSMSLAGVTSGVATNNFINQAGKAKDIRSANATVGPGNTPNVMEKMRLEKEEAEKEDDEIITRSKKKAYKKQIKKAVAFALNPFNKGQKNPYVTKENKEDFEKALEDTKKGNMVIQIREQLEKEGMYGDAEDTEDDEEFEAYNSNQETGLAAWLLAGMPEDEVDELKKKAKKRGMSDDELEAFIRNSPLAELMAMISAKGLTPEQEEAIKASIRRAIFVTNQGNADLKEIISQISMIAGITETELYPAIADLKNKGSNPLDYEKFIPKDKETLTSKYKKLNLAELREEKDRLENILKQDNLFEYEVVNYTKELAVIEKEIIAKLF